MTKSSLQNVQPCVIRRQVIAGKELRGLSAEQAVIDTPPPSYFIKFKSVARKKLKKGWSLDDLVRLQHWAHVHRAPPYLEDFNGRTVYSIPPSPRCSLGVQAVVLVNVEELLNVR